MKKYNVMGLDFKTLETSTDKMEALKNFIYHSRNQPVMIQVDDDGKHKGFLVHDGCSASVYDQPSICGGNGTQSKTVQCGASLTSIERSIAMHVGGGNLTRGIRIALYRAMVDISREEG